MAVPTPPLTLVTWFHADAPDHAGSYAQTLGDAASAGHYETYLRCVDLCVASFRRWNPQGACLVVLNDRADHVVDAVRRAFWAATGVDVLVAENRHLPGEDLYSRWQNQFFLFDVIEAAVERAGAGSAPIVVVDSDCLVRAPLDDLAAAIVAEQRVAMTVGYEEDADIHGVTRRRLGDFVRDRGTALDGVPEYLGGEFVAGTADGLRGLLEQVEEVYRWTLDRRTAGLDHPNEEAHVISVADPLLPAQVNGNRFVERIWTQPWTFRRFGAGVRRVPIWHLPAEKRTGIARLQRAARRPDSWFHTAAPAVWRRRVGVAVGVPRYGVGKALRDARVLGGRALAARIGRSPG